MVFGVFLRSSPGSQVRTRLKTRALHSPDYGELFYGLMLVSLSLNGNLNILVSM
ncbi:hypothetical protein PJE062_3360 [Pseudovibrio sp. JE062]|nr:hypothetical protein PJE062_3360 [Pseudovibrio sp. JE062]